ncbi:MAG TPA: anaerobic ribonucleoside-triphosphate reductase [Candidatus Methanofastidiosa archaeon]|nr:anaerobic ribonucleoside-triphosphate reductase [Candidatus Methanofastidiosa archaeon]
MTHKNASIRTKRRQMLLTEEYIKHHPMIDQLPLVRTINQDLEKFDPAKIVKIFMEEADLPIEEAERYTESILFLLESLYLKGKLKYITTRMIRELMCVIAVMDGDFATRDKLTVVGMPVSDVEKLFFGFDFDNSNQIPCEEFIHKIKGDCIDEQYSLLKLYNIETPIGNPAYAHMNKDIYIHDRDYPARPFCYQHSGRFIFRSGLRVDGNGKYSNVSKPAKRLDVAVRHTCEFLGAASRNWNGGQGFRNLFWELGPFLEDEAKRSMETVDIDGYNIPAGIVQSAQMLRYEPNHVFVGRGSQAAFSSLVNFAEPPKYLTEDADIVLPGGKVIQGDYSEYKDYVLMFWHAYLYHSAKGDANGGMFHWMKDDTAIKPKWFKDDDLCEHVYRPLMRYISKFGGPYVYNVKGVKDDEVACTSCCSLVLETDDPEDFELARQGTLGMGALQCGSFNLPRIAYLANGDDDVVFELIRERMNLLKYAMVAKRDFMRKVLASGLSPFLMQSKMPGVDDSPYFDLDKQSVLLSFCGMNEFVTAHMGSQLHESKESHNFAMRILIECLDHCKQLTEETGINFAIWRQPGETMPGKFAQDDWNKFRNKAVVQGDPRSGSAYYNNFTHCNVDSGIDVFSKIKNEAPFHGLVSSNLLHIWLGEEDPNPDSIWELTKRIVDKSLTSYFAFTKEITVCNKCHSTYSGVVANCKCGAGPRELVVQSRITGYYSTVGTVDSILKWRSGNKRSGLSHAHWQPSKFAEFNNRAANIAGRRFGYLDAEREVDIDVYESEAVEVV